MEKVHRRGKKKPAVLHRKIAGFRCEYHTSMSDYGDDGFLAEYEGNIFVFLDGGQEDEESEYPAGQARLFMVNAEAAENADESLFDVLDYRSETAAYIPLIEEEAGSFSHAVCKVLGEEMVLCRNMLILDRLEILPQFRGQKLGLQYMRAAINRFGIGCRLAAIKPFPLQFEGKLGSVGVSTRDGEKECAAPSKSMLAEFDSATVKLRKYYAREGFVALKGVDLMILDLYKQRQSTSVERA